MSFDLDDVRKVSNLPSVDLVCNEDEDMTRQEFKQECDVNHILRQHGYMVRPVRYGEHNFDDDLTVQMQSRSVFQLWYDSAPEEVRAAYPDLGSFLAAMGSGALKTGLDTTEVSSGESSPSAKPPEAAAQG